MKDFEKLYSLMHASLSGELVVNAVDFPVDMDLPLARGDFQPAKPVRFGYHMGRRRTDFLRCGLPVISLASDRFIDILKAGGFSGWRTFPVTILGKDKQEISGYSGLAITGRCGPLDNPRCERKTRPAKWPAVRAVPAWYGLYFDLSTWDGSDLFMPEGTGFIFVTEPAKSALEKAKITNKHLTRHTEDELLVL